VPGGGNLDTSTVGVHSFTVNAVDNVGNKSAQTLSYFVGYAVCPQYDPTKALPHLIDRDVRNQYGLINRSDHVWAGRLEHAETP